MKTKLNLPQRVERAISSVKRKRDACRDVSNESSIPRVIHSASASEYAYDECLIIMDKITEETT